jgi:DNA-binding NarL/FixJ family response regulator
MTGAPSSRQNAPVTFVVYTRRPPAPELAAALIGRGHSVMERGFSAAMHELLHVLRPDVIVACLNPADAGDLEAFQSLKTAARESLIVLASTSADEVAAIHVLDQGADAYMGSQTPPEVVRDRRSLGGDRYPAP